MLQKVFIDDNSILVEFICSFYNDDSSGVLEMVVVELVVLVVVVTAV